MKRTICIALCLLLLAAAAFGQNGGSQGSGSEGSGSQEGAAQSPESMFEGPMVEQAPQAQAPAAPEQTFLRTQGVKWGGSFTAEFTTTWAWTSYPATLAELLQPQAPVLATDLEADLYFDARPATDFRVFGKSNVSYAYDPATAAWAWNLSVFELFSDFQWKDHLFFRVGKQVVHWGVGYFFSPADVLSLVAIDPQHPEKEREGPVALKVQAPLGNNNLYLYAVANDITDPSRIAVAPKAEVVLGNWELGLGGFYQRDLAPKGMLTVSGPLWKTQLIGEAVLQYGSDRTFLRSTALPPFYETYKREGLLFSGTLGLLYRNAEPQIAAVVQYYFNGQGYTTPPDLLLLHTAALAGDLSAADLSYPGQHYGAATFIWSEIGGSPLRFSALWLSNLSDLSGYLLPQVSWKLLDYAIVSVGARFAYGEAGDEFAPQGSGFSLLLDATLGTGDF